MPQTIPEVTVDSVDVNEELGKHDESQSNGELTDAPQEPEPSLIVKSNVAFDAMRNEPLLTNVLVEVYDGETDDRGFLHGFGTAYFQGGNVYTGQFENGLMHGRGKYVWSNKTVYEGDFVENQLCGYGVYIWPDGSVYEGEVKDGLRHGEGTFKCSSVPCSYSGMWRNGKREGRGCLKYDKDGLSYYEGNWRENQRHGYGTRRYASGNVYEGEWKDNVRHGQGTMHWYTTNEKYCGQWLNGVQHGYGEHMWFLRRIKGSQYPLRNRYVGDWVNGLRHGCGVFYYANGARYDGEWVNNMKHGKGMFVFKNGVVFEGLFESDHMLEFPDINPSGMITPDITSSGLPIRAGTPGSSILSGDLTTGLELNINHLFDDRDVDLDQQVEEAQQVNYVLLQHISKLKEIYTFYTAIGNDTSLDNTLVMIKMQFCRFLKDCKVHHHGISLPEILRVTNSDWNGKNLHNPWENILMRDFLTALVTIAYHMYADDYSPANQMVLPWCLSQLITLNVLRHACSVGGVVYSEPGTALELSQYFPKSYAVYELWTQPRKLPPHDQSFDMRKMLWMLKDYNLIDQNLSAKEVIKILARDDPRVEQDGFINLEIEISFLEFFEAIVGCAVVYVTDSLLRESPKQSVSASSQCLSARSPISTASVKRGETPDQGNRLSSHSVLNPANEKPDGEQFPTTEERQPNVSKNVDIPIFKVSASPTDDPDRKSMEDSARNHTERGVSDICLTESQQEVLRRQVAPEANNLVDGPRAATEGALLEDDFDLWCAKISYFFKRKFFPAAEKHELLTKIAKEDL